MANRVYYGDVGTLQVVGGATFNLLLSSTTARMTVTNQSADGGGLGTLDSAPTFTKRSAMLNVTSLSGTNLRVTNIDVTALSLNGTSYVASVRGGSMRLAFTHDEGSGVGDKEEQPNVTGRTISGDVSLVIPTSAFHAIYARVLSTTISDLEFAFTITLGGATITIPVFASEWTHEADRGKVQLVTLKFEGKAAQDGTTAYPTAAPSASSSLLGSAFSDPRSLVTYAFKTSASSGAGLQYSGSAVFDSVSFAFNDKTVIKTEYSLKTHGTITVAAA